MNKKCCTKCGIQYFATTEFFNKNIACKDGLNTVCKNCKSIQNKNYRIKHKNEIKSTKQKYYKKNRRKLRQNIKKYQSLHKLYYREWHKQYKKQNSDHLRKYKREYNQLRRKSDISFRILNNLRSRLNSAIKYNRKSLTTIKLLGCSIQELKQYLESQFKSGMTWDNYGDWHIDHILPCAIFDMSDPEQQKICFYYTNLQPLWKLDNIKKGKKLNV